MNSPVLDFRTVNSLWASVFVETLVRAGVPVAVVSPGSRSTPLAFALAAHPRIEAIPVLDERSAGFFALGLAKRRGCAVALLCTSGTAGANYFPAVIEAREAGVPLLVMTADRPPEMRACASGQTIDQQKLFGAYPVAEQELAVPEAAEPLLRYLRQTVARAVARCAGPIPGPVHLNVPFRDPLAPVAEAGPDSGGGHPDGHPGGPPVGLKERLQAVDWDAFFARLGPEPAVRITGDGEVPEFSPASHGLIVAGPATTRDPEGYAAAVGEISRKLGWPILADALSPLRGHASRLPHLVTTYDAILRNADAAERLRPETVLALGEWPTSKVLRGWLERCGAPTTLVSPRPGNRDALHGATRQVCLSLPQLAQGLCATPEAGDYARLWAGCEERVRARLDALFGAEERLVEPKAAWLLARHLPEGTPVSVANSMPVRDLEYVWPPNDRRIRPFFNRGANGIDGTLSTALGVAHGGRPSALLTGDLALLHDTNGFLIRPKLRGSLTVILINNRGGGIFGHLPVARFEPPFEEFFATPQQVDFGRLASAYGVEHHRVEDWSQFEALVGVLPEQGLRVLEVQTDRVFDADFRKRLFADLAESAGSPPFPA